MKLIRVPAKVRLPKDFVARLPKNSGFIDLTGTKFNQLEVIGLAGFAGVYGLWLCQCSCGNKSLITSGAINASDVISCMSCSRRRVGVKNTGTSKKNTFSKPTDDKTLYNVWSQHRHGNRLCKSWNKSYTAFCKAVGQRPSTNHWLRRIDASKPFSASNFYWLETVPRSLVAVLEG